MPYLAALGVSHLYTSPILQAAPGSTHGYDVVDHARINAELGGADGYERLLAVLAAHGMGHVLDIVPNHMAIAGRANAWWWDVLENGPASRHAHAFDIDWAGGDAQSTARVLVPVLADQIGRVLEAGELAVAREGGSFTVCYFDHELPLSPRTLDELLGAAAVAAGSDELASLATAFGHLPHATDTDPAAMAERHRDKELLRERLAALVEQRAGGRRRRRRAAGGRQRRPRRPRRAAAAPELPPGVRGGRPARSSTTAASSTSRRWSGSASRTRRCSHAAHALIAELVARGAVRGAARRPRRRAARSGGVPRTARRDLTGGTPVVVEKILEGDEELPAWPVAGTTGYEFARRVDGLFVDGAAEAAMTAAYVAFIGDDRAYEDVVAGAKQQIMRDELRAEVERITGMLAAVCQHHRRHRDHTRHELREAVRATLAAFAVYRTYVRAGHAHDAPSTGATSTMPSSGWPPPAPTSTPSC